MALISSKTTEDKRLELEIEVGEEVFAPVLERVIKNRSSQITLPGFRKGKAPRNLIIKAYGMGAFIEDAVNELYSKAYDEAVDEAGVEPVDVANIEMTSADEKGFAFKATVAVKPEVELGQYKGLAVTKVLAPVDEGKVDEQISATRERNARIVSVSDRPAKDGDVATIDFEGFIDDVAFEGGKGEAYPLTLGSGSFIPGFEDQVIGKSVGESFDVNVTFPEEYGVPELNGKPAVFKVCISELTEKELPELDDEFAKDVSEFDTFDEYRLDLKTKLEEAAEKSADSTMENDLMNMVVADMKVEVPKAMNERRIDELMRDFEQRLRMQGLDMEQFLSYTGERMETFRASLEPQAKQQVLVRLALEAIVKAENITPSDEQLEAEYERLANMYGLEASKIKTLVLDEDMRQDLACNMALDLVKSEAVVTLSAEAAASEGEETEQAAQSETQESDAPKETDEDANADEPVKADETDNAGEPDKTDATAKADDTVKEKKPRAKRAAKPKAVKEKEAE